MEISVQNHDAPAELGPNKETPLISE